MGGLIGLGLAEVVTGKGSIALRVTESGRSVASDLRESPEWSGVAARAMLLKRHLDLTGNTLKTMIYQELPDVVDRPHRTVIAASSPDADSARSAN